MKQPKIPKTQTGQRKLKSKLARKALRLWFEVGALLAGPSCAVCGAAHGTLNAKGKPQWLNGHHIEDKNNYALRFDLKNHVHLCPTCHKWGVDSAHRAPVWFIDWLREHRLRQYVYVLHARRLKPSQLADWTIEMLVEAIETLERAKESHDSVDTEGDQAAGGLHGQGQTPGDDPCGVPAKSAGEPREIRRDDGAAGAPAKNVGA